MRVEGDVRWQGGGCSYKRIIRGIFEMLILFNFLTVVGGGSTNLHM